MTSPTGPKPQGASSSIHSPLEVYSTYRGADWSPERLAFHQNLEAFAERVGFIVALQANGKMTQERAYSHIKKLWSQLKDSKGHLLH